MRELDREVAGLTCRQVLASLSDYLDGELAAVEVAQVEAHVQGCDRCERFGGEFGAVVGALRRELAEPPPIPDGGVVERLRQRLLL